MVIVLTIFLIMTIVVLLTFICALNGNKTSAPHRLRLTRAMTVYVVKAIIPPTVVGFTLYLTNDKNVFYVFYWSEAIIGGLLAIWWRWSFVEWYEQLKKGDYLSTLNETAITDISVINE